MACGYIALQNAGFEIEEYYAYEIDKFAIKCASHNFPKIIHCGDVFEADFNRHCGIDWLIGGSPCTFWSISNTKNRETKPEGIGYELFMQYVRAIKESAPKFFLYENNKSMSKDIRQAITDAFGFEPICINSALLSAQHRERLYWVGKRNPDGTYSKVEIEPPGDRGILLIDILEDPRDEKGYELGKYDLTQKEFEYMSRAVRDGRTHWDFGHHNESTNGKSRAITANMRKGVPYNVLVQTISDRDDLQ